MFLGNGKSEDEDDFRGIKTFNNEHPTPNIQHPEKNQIPIKSGLDRVSPHRGGRKNSKGRMKKCASAQRRPSGMGNYEGRRRNEEVRFEDDLSSAREDSRPTGVIRL
jgi:hypothetical protein